MSEVSVGISDRVISEDIITKVRWVMPHNQHCMTFISQDVLAVAHDLYIIFFNFKNNTETLYVANNEKDGDGVDVIGGHTGNIFAFAEKVRYPRIFVMMYPTFSVLAQLKDNEVKRYKAVCMMECELVVGFSGFPDHLVTVWSWRSRQRLVSAKTGILRRIQLYMASHTHMLICECYGEGLVVWEVAQVYRRCLLLKRSKRKNTGWEVSEPPLVAICWTHDGHLYAIDSHAKLYSVTSDGIGMVTNEEWSEQLEGPDKPCMCSLGNGILIYGPDHQLRYLKQYENSWKVVWQRDIDTVTRLVSNSGSDMAAAWTDRGFMYRITVAADEHVDIELFAFKQRHVIKIQLLAPEFTHIAMIDNAGVLCIYEVHSAKLVQMKHIQGNDISFETSPVDPLVVVVGEVGHNYGLTLLQWSASEGLHSVGSMTLTHQIVSRVVFAPTGRELLVSAMSAGHVFIMKLSKHYKLTVVRYTEVGRGLADCCLMRVGDAMRAFILVLFSDKFSIGERIICINAMTGKDNKFAGKMQGPYSRLLPLAMRDTMLAVPHLSRNYHVLKMSGDKGATVTVRMGPIVDSAHDIRYFDAFAGPHSLLTFDYAGSIVKRHADAPEHYDYKVSASHRYESGIKYAVTDTEARYVAHVAGNHTVALLWVGNKRDKLPDELALEPIDENLFEKSAIEIFDESEKNYLDLQEEKIVGEEAMDYRSQREEVVRTFEEIQNKAVDLLEENLEEPPLHQLSLSEFNLHLENKKERLKQAEKEREELRLKTEARIRAQDKVTAWIKANCWDVVLTQRTKLFAIFSHYQVENFAVLPTQREHWPELKKVEALRLVEMENDEDLFRPWQEQVQFDDQPPPDRPQEMEVSSTHRIGDVEFLEAEGAEAARECVWWEAAARVLLGTGVHQLMTLPPVYVPQTLAYSFLQMNWQHQNVKLNVQNLRLWFNKQFDELMAVKRREVGLVLERNSRLRFIIEELNKLSDLRGSFHHLTIEIKDPQWKQEEEPHKLIKVEPEECSITPYISPSQIVIVPPEPGPKDDFRERALQEMMDGVLEKLWHEEIKKPIPMPLCMLEKDPEHFNEEDLRQVFDYESKVRFREEERDKYRKMLHAEYGALAKVLNEGIVKFNQKVKDAWLMKLKVDSIIGQENMNLMRLRRINLDRVEMDEELDRMRDVISRNEQELDELQQELSLIQQQQAECQAAAEALAQKDRNLEKAFRNYVGDLSPIIAEQSYKIYRKRPKWHQRVALIPAVLYEMVSAVLAGHRPLLLPHDCIEFCRGLDHLDLVNHMPAVMDEALWVAVCKMRRAKIENEIRMRAVTQEAAYVETAVGVWGRAVNARRALVARTHEDIAQHRDFVEHNARNKTIQLVLPAGQVEITTTGHMADFEDAALVPRDDIQLINNLIRKVGAMKLSLMRKQIDFRKGILSKEWQHAQMKMKLRHMQQELNSYRKLKIPKELQLYLKNKELGYSEELEFSRMEKEMESSKISLNRRLEQQVQRAEEMQVKVSELEGRVAEAVQLLEDLIVRVSEKRLREDPLEPIRVRRVLQTRMGTLVCRSRLVREVQRLHTTIALLQTELELLRLRTYPTLASFRTIDT